ncbi:MAG: Lrp/AsnC family transcriptional regulator [Candidatus Pacearchaeota archaeon]|jgi:DNA-binding Lrp family transcriptional regulator
MELDLKDKKILYELDKNSRISLTDLAKKLKTSKEVVHYRINNLIKNKIILKFHTVPSTYRFGMTAYKIYLRLQDISKEKYDELISYLLKNKDVFWVGTARGRWDLMFGVWATSMEEFFKIHDQLLDKFSKYLQEKELSVSREVLQYNRRWLYYDTLVPIEFNFGEKEPKIILDEEDNKILDEIINSSREKIIDIAEKTGISPDMVSYRIKKMEKEKIIQGYKCLLNPTELGFVTTKAFVFFKNINEEKKAGFINYCKMLPSTINMVITFAPWDLEIEFETKNYESYFKIMDDIKEKFKDIIRFYDSVLITAELKQIFIKK